MPDCEEWLRWGRSELNFLGPRESLAESELFLSRILDTDRTDLYLRPGREVSEEEASRYRDWIRQRKEGVPAAYLVGQAGFWNEILEVGPGCLIPRPETETLVERFLGTPGYGKEDVFSLLDLGTGSGAIGIAILRERPKATAVFSDISPRALEMTRRNIARYGLDGRAECVLSDLFSGLGGRRWNAIVSNPPYFSGSDWAVAAPEILSEPRIALDGGADGLRFYRLVAEEAPRHLHPGGWIFLEVGKGQAARVGESLERYSFGEVRIFEDVLGVQRVVAGVRPEGSPAD